MPESKPVKLRIRTKFIGILVIASLLPLGIALVAFNRFGNLYYMRSQRTICQTAASRFSLTVGRALRNEVNLLDQWIAFTGIGGKVEAINKTASPMSVEAIAAIEARWPVLPDDAPEISAFLNNDLASALREFQKQNPNFAEIFVTDRWGRLIAATNRTSDYWQADENWWQIGFGMGPDTTFVEGLTFDESSGTHSISLAVPLFSSRKAGDKPAGVLKAVLNVMPFFQSIPPAVGNANTEHEIALGSGEILARLGDTALVPLKERLPEAVVEKFREGKPGSVIANLPGAGNAIFGFAPLGVASTQEGDIRIEGLKPAWAVAYRDEKTAMAPLRDSLAEISLAGTGLAIVFVFAGYLTASKRIISPIDRLRRAARAISRTVKLDEEPAVTTGQHAAARESSDLLRDVESIKTGDEIEDLAGEFAFMGKRILSYHEKLEAEIADKTREIRRDLDFAKQFQTNLMPRKYPEVPPSAQRPGLGLDFHHIYKPASTVGGDFFNVMKLGDSRAGIFIADVMGHGARSALVTAIIATLLQDFGSRASDPGEVLKMLNEHFYRVVRGTGDTVFVSAFYLVLDVEAQSAKFASAGHPSPLLLDRQGGRVIELTPHLARNPALGIFETSSYEVFSRPIRERDLFLLFTDGLFECTDGAGQEFGRARLVRIVEEHRESSLSELTDLLVDSASAFAGKAGFSDDVCLVGVEVLEKSARTTAG